MTDYGAEHGAGQSEDVFVPSWIATRGWNLPWRGAAEISNNQINLLVSVMPQILSDFNLAVTHDIFLKSISYGDICGAGDTKSPQTALNNSSANCVDLWAKNHVRFRFLNFFNFLHCPSCNKNEFQLRLHFQICFTKSSEHLKVKFCPHEVDRNSRFWWTESVIRQLQPALSQEFFLQPRSIERWVLSISQAHLVVVLVALLHG